MSHHRTKDYGAVLESINRKLKRIEVEVKDPVVITDPDLSKKMDHRMNRIHDKIIENVRDCLDETHKDQYELIKAIGKLDATIRSYIEVEQRKLKQVDQLRAGYREALKKHGIVWEEGEHPWLKGEPAQTY